MINLGWLSIVTQLGIRSIPRCLPAGPRPRPGKRWARPEKPRRNRQVCSWEGPGDILHSSLLWAGGRSGSQRTPAPMSGWTGSVSRSPGDGAVREPSEASAPGLSRGQAWSRKEQEQAKSPERFGRTPWGRGAGGFAMGSSLPGAMYGPDAVKHTAGLGLGKKRDPPEGPFEEGRPPS